MFSFKPLDGVQWEWSVLNAPCLKPQLFCCSPCKAEQRKTEAPPLPSFPVSSVMSHHEHLSGHLSQGPLIRTLLSCDQALCPLLGSKSYYLLSLRGTWNAVASVFPRWHNLKFFWYNWKYLRQAERGVSVDGFVLSIRFFGKLIQNGKGRKTRAPIARNIFNLWEDPVPSKELLYVNLSKFHQSIGCASRERHLELEESCKLLSCLPSQPPEWPAKCQSGWDLLFWNFGF